MQRISMDRKSGMPRSEEVLLLLDHLEVNFTEVVGIKISSLGCVGTFTRPNPQFM